MDSTLQHEDLLLKLRAKLNSEKIKLWEPPYFATDHSISPSLKELASKYASQLSIDTDAVLEALRELQLHSLDRSKENAEFKETGVATFRVKTTVPGEKPRIIKVVKKLDLPGREVIAVIAAETGVSESSIKLIYNGKVVKPDLNLDEQGLKNGVQMMALVMAETPEEVREEDNMYLEMKRTRDDATLLTEYVDDLNDDEEYIKLEDQSGNAIELPASERRALLVGLALHERGRALAAKKQYPAALVLLLEADSMLSECRWSLLQQTDNVGVLQLDIAWCYLALQSVPPDAALRLQRAEDALRRTYSKPTTGGSKACESVLFMRLYLLQGIMAYHQNNREEAKALLAKAEVEINALRVEPSSVSALVELGWSAGAARAGLRAAAGDPAAAHHYLHERREGRADRRDRHRAEREQRLLGECSNGTPVNADRVVELMADGVSRRRAARALRRADNDIEEARRIITDTPDTLKEDNESSDESESPSSEESIVEPDSKMLAELQAMGYAIEDAKTALSMANNHVNMAVEILVAAGGHVASSEDPCNPSTSTGTAPKRKHKKHKKDKRRREREQALRRLTSAIRHDEDDYLDSALIEEEDFLAQYKSLL